MNRIGITAAMVFAVLSARSAPAADGAKLFVDLCTACHSIGGGDLAGPDLIHATRWSREDIRKAILRMQDNVGPLQPDQIDALIVFLTEPDVKAHFARATAPPPELSPEEKAASAVVGRKLFFGDQRLANGGSPCFACHTVAGRGGNLAVDLTGVNTRRGPTAIVATSERPGFPLMKAAYAGRTVTRQEAFHLAAFFNEAEAGAPKQGPPRAERMGAVQGMAGGIAVVVMGAVALIFRSRRGGLRSRMVRKSSGGER
ncbi:MAG TPA: cytochrome c [Thermoanaerobaculia bacterium]|nr:cytochrome c [Thermoanaerobaculia bacterium]